MAKILKDMSHTFDEYLLIPGYSNEDAIVQNVSLKAPLTRFKKGEAPKITLNIPLVSAIMQSVSNDTLAIALAKEGGISFIYGSQPIEAQAQMVKKVKDHKAGFVISDSNLKPSNTLQDVLNLLKITHHSTMCITQDGSANGKLLGLVTSRDYRLSRMPLDTPIASFMTGLDHLIIGDTSMTLSDANDKIWDHKLNALPIVDEHGNLSSIVFRKDYDSHKEHPDELQDTEKRLLVGAGINTRDYKERVPALLDAGADVLCIDSSEGHSEWQRKTIRYIKETFGENTLVGAGNVVDDAGFRFLADAGADFIKVGIGGGSICITRETKGIGRGQASSILAVAQERNRYFQETGIYVPICSDGGIVYDHHITLALAMGADFCMLGRYFSRFDESPTNKVFVNGRYMKEYWGEGSARARNWQRYDLGGDSKLSFEEGVDSYVPYAGTLKDNVLLSLTKVKSTMCNCGALTINDLQEKAVLTLVSPSSIQEGSAHDVLLKNKVQ